ncbi:hypothetical protein OS493_039673 [Desmophyllum pertusum]|uniref:Ig-like domain-containing protein n=1 Tax=Desmophyllum pertusum TaxID=174260 RepID=A0A9X0CHC8_9CNID|nr:hypothetical protein OS493_039673 [Desmophyllum pertusum]
MGRVNVTQPYGNLVISHVKIEDAGQFLCHYKVYMNRSEEYDKSIVELCVFEASVPVITIYAVGGMQTVQLPCSVIHHINPEISPRDIELLWAMKKEGKTDWRMVIVNDKDGLTETFRQPILGGSIFANHSQKNEQFYGRVNVTQLYGNLVISHVKIEDAGQFLCLYTNRSKEHDMSIVELYVFEAPAQTGSNFTCPGNATAGANNTTGHGNGTSMSPGNSNDDIDCPCTIGKTLFGVLFGLVLLGLLGLGGVFYKLYPAWRYYKREQSNLLVGDGSPRCGNTYIVENGNCEEKTSV